MERQTIAVIGGGIAGLSAAWLLARRHRVTLYEANSHLGGHANTVDVETADGVVPVDTGFIVYNERNYPNLSGLFRHLGVVTQPAEMSFALSLDEGAYEYSGSSARGFFGQPRNLLSSGHWRLLKDVSRFFKTAEARVATCEPHLPLGAFLETENYSVDFIERHIVPMGAAIWSTGATEMLGFPARSFIDFYANHGMLQFRNRPTWRSVAGGSRNYVAKIVADGGFEVLKNDPALRVVRHAHYVHIADGRGTVRPFDQVVIATHADQALSVLNAPDAIESAMLGAFTYQRNRAVLHRDHRFMPRRQRIWSSWNYLQRVGVVEGEWCVTYWMNRLQQLQTDTNLFVTLNPPSEIHPKAEEAAFNYRHPVFSAAAMDAQKGLWTLQGRRRTWFCGSYFGFGFHEDGLQSGLAVAEAIGGSRRPWRVAEESGRISLPNASLIEAAE